MNILVGPAELKDSQTQNLETTLHSLPESDLDMWPPVPSTSP